jgi:hypothetical protein
LETRTDVRYKKLIGAFQRAKEERLLLKTLKNRRQLWVGCVVRHNEFVVNIFERAASGNKAMGRP